MEYISYIAIATVVAMALQTLLTKSVGSPIAASARAKIAEPLISFPFVQQWDFSTPQAFLHIMEQTLIGGSLWGRRGRAAQWKACLYSLHFCCRYHMLEVSPCKGRMKVSRWQGLPFSNNWKPRTGTACRGLIQ